MQYLGKLRNRLKTANELFLTIYISLAAFLIYACMYGLRKPFTVAEYKGLSLWGIDYKALLIISQVIGYALSKFIGITIISEMKRNSRALAIIILTVVAELALVMFGIFPRPYNIIMIFFNGLPLGMIWGLVFAYLEGRRNTEILGTALSISFIVSSGFVKSIGKMLMSGFHLTDFQMPWITGLFFLIPLVIMVPFLDIIPDPDDEDISQRSRRIPMDKKQRADVFREFAPGLVVLILSYIILTIFRDMRDNFSADIWNALGMNTDSMIFTWSELPIALIVFIVMSSLMYIKDNRVALNINYVIVLSGFVIIGISTLLLQVGLLSPLIWMILLGLGTYLGYLPFNCLMFDRLVAAFGSAANAGFFIYLADSFGYLGSVGTLLFKNFYNKDVSWFSFLRTASYGMAVSGILLIIMALIYFNLKIKEQRVALIS